MPTTAWGGQPPNLTGSAHWGAPGIGILGATLAAAWTAGEHGPSPLANDGLDPANEYLWYVATVQAGLTVQATELGTVSVSTTADGQYTWSYRLAEAGVLLGSGPTMVSVNVGGTLALLGAACAVATACSTGLVSLSLQLTLVAAACAQGNNCSTAAVLLGQQLALVAAACTQAANCSTAVVQMQMALMARGTYASQQDLVERFGATELAQLTDPAAGANVNATTVARALSDADAEINTRLARRYALPLAVVPAVLVRIAADLARYFLWDARASEQVRNRFREATALLDKMGSGAIALPDAAQLVPAANAVAVLARSRRRQFGSDVLDTFGPSQ